MLIETIKRLLNGHSTSLPKTDLQEMKEALKPERERQLPKHPFTIPSVNRKTQPRN